MTRRPASDTRRAELPVQRRLCTMHCTLALYCARAGSVRGVGEPAMARCAHLPKRHRARLAHGRGQRDARAEARADPGLERVLQRRHRPRAAVAAVHPAVPLLHARRAPATPTCQLGAPLLLHNPGCSSVFEAATVHPGIWRACTPAMRRMSRIPSCSNKAATPHCQLHPPGRVQCWARPAGWR